MKAITLVVALGVALWSCAGCMTWQAPVQPPRGLLITVYSAPLTTDFAQTPVGGKTGKATTLYLRDIIFTGQTLAWDDASVATAARNAGLTTITYADYEILEVLGVFGKFTIRVHGE